MRLVLSTGKGIMGLTAFLLVGASSWLKEAQADPVRVRLSRAEAKVVLDGVNLQLGLGPNRALPVGSPSARRAEVKVLRRHGGLPVWEIRDTTTGERQRLVGSALWAEGEGLKIGAEPVPRILELRATETGRIDVIASLDLEKYLMGVLPAEMPATWSMETLKAQAVASRSYAMALIRERKGQSFHLESTVFDQVYRFSSHHSADAQIQDRIARAVSETKGQYLVDERGRVLKAYYHADCGGQTETVRNVWGERGVESGTVKDGLCPLSPHAQWRFRISRRDLKERLASFLGLSRETSLKSLAIAGRTPSGRVSELDVTMAGYPSRRIRSHEFRQALGFSNLRSTNFDLQWLAGDLLIEGRGHGHGVGLCQYGAMQLGQRGLNYSEILKNYYPRAQLKKPASREARKMAKVDGSAAVY